MLFISLPLGGFPVGRNRRTWRKPTTFGRMFDTGLEPMTSVVGGRCLDRSPYKTSLPVITKTGSQLAASTCISLQRTHSEQTSILRVLLNYRWKQSQRAANQFLRWLEKRLKAPNINSSDSRIMKIFWAKLKRTLKSLYQLANQLLKSETPIYFFKRNDQSSTSNDKYC